MVMYRKCSQVRLLIWDPLKVRLFSSLADTIGKRFSFSNVLSETQLKHQKGERVLKGSLNIMKCFLQKL